ncbi:CARDB domain-containing protein [Candidatus Palauibacter soopunensis]|uniref:CARDB domain-containing protein n=1 Tax=Candidatus Palauibacter soopunensis TaxID=3056739 RepID=UPI0023A69931|nr:CARDB domain-containing protein [Candidatus Palauibacter soopunensis]MDE2878599.1 hypothetical protein [Candidatus Palauibacter soopunensis]
MSVNAEGRVIELYFDGSGYRNGYGLKGELPSEIGDLSKLDVIVIGGNPGLTGALPESIKNLSDLQVFNTDPGTNLCVPATLESWLNELYGKASGDGVDPMAACGDHEALLAFRSSTNYPEWNEKFRVGTFWEPGWQNSSPSGGPLNWPGLEWTDSSAVQRVTNITTGSYAATHRFWLDGTLPSELGNLTSLTTLDFNGEGKLQGPLPSTVVNLEALTYLDVTGTKICTPDDAAVKTWLPNLDEAKGLLPDCLGPYDLAAAKFNHSTPTDQGVPFQLSVTVENKGTGTSTPTKVTFTRSTDNVKDASDTDLGSENLAELAGDAEQTVSLEVRVDAVGAYWFYACIATDGRDADKSNDCTAPRKIEISDPNQVTGDRAVLTQLYATCNGSGWLKQRNWTSKLPLRRWAGVKTTNDGRVTELNLGDVGGNHLNCGSSGLPGNLAQLEMLEKMVFWGNDRIGGVIPSWINGTNFPNLVHLDLDATGLTGRIPDELGTLSNLEKLFIRDNGLTGEIPGSFSKLKKLKVFWAFGNELTGGLTPVVGMRNLESLQLNSNNLDGEIPDGLGKAKNLQELILYGNRLSGEIPVGVAGLRDLRTLDLSSNFLTGPIPPELGGLDDLIWLMLDENDLSGPIPSGLGDTSLKILRLNNNNLSGPIPVELGKLKDLEELNVAVNPGLRGEIPPEVLALNMHHFWSWATSLCVPRGGDFESYISRENWMGNACGETEPGFQIQLLFSPETPDDIRDAMESQAEYWMEILRDTEAPDLFGFEKPLCYGVRPWTLPSPIIDDVLVTIEYGEGEITSGGVCGLTDMFPHRIPYQGYADFDPAVTRDPHWLDIIARRLLGHALGFGEALWGPRGQLMDPSTSEQAPDTHVVSPRAEEAFDAAGGTSYTGPKIPLQQDGSNGQWRSSVFGSEIMSAAWSRSGHVPTSAVTLQALADLSYTVDLSYANPFALLSAAASAALGADESGWEAPPVVVSCRSRVQPDAGQEGLSTGLYPSPVRACAREF